MSDKAAKPAGKLAGVTSFGINDDADCITTPPREVPDQAKAGAAALGFVSDKPAAPSPRAGRAGRAQTHLPAVALSRPL